MGTASTQPSLVIGGGPAGAALATRLAGAGREVVLLERELGPTDKVCGEFLSREAALYLTSLGLDLRALGAVPIDAVRLCERDHVATVRLPFAAHSLSRRVLDEALLERAAARGARVLRGAKVNELSRTEDGWRARLDDGTSIEGGAAFLATGKHDLRSHKRPPGLQNDLVAFKLHWRLAPKQTNELDRHVELVLFEGGYAGLQPVEGGHANLCLVVRRTRLARLGRGWDKLLAAMRAESPHLDARLAGGEPCWAKPLALSAIPYGYVRHHADGPWRLGDQAAVIPSFSGDGMSIALHSAELAATTYLEGGDADAYQRRLARDVSGQVRLATLLSHGLVRRPAQVALGAAARVWPGLMSSVAFHTRVSDAALSRTMLASQP
ncbi:MAG TPA: FAD-dependent monooxygenase [Labilithrix sp.]|nr:FAD-dependent monooxygenase [Labilithrix sp.]